MYKNLYITGGHGQDGTLLTNIFLKNSKYKVNIITNKKNFKKKKNVNYYNSNLQYFRSVKKIFLKNISFRALFLLNNGFVS